MLATPQDASSLRWFGGLELVRRRIDRATRKGLCDSERPTQFRSATGCKKFVARFGLEAMKFVNSGEGKRLCLRGINAKVVKSGSFAVGDRATKLASD